MILQLLWLVTGTGVLLFLGYGLITLYAAIPDKRLRIFLGFALGTGVTSVAAFGWLVLNGVLSRTYLWGEWLTAALVAGSLVYRRARSGQASRCDGACVVGETAWPVSVLSFFFPFLSSRAARRTSAGCLDADAARHTAAPFLRYAYGFFLCFFAVAVAFRIFVLHPTGLFDHRAIWGLGADLLYHGEQGIAVLLDKQQFYHPEYPLCLQATIARLYTYMDTRLLAANWLVSYLFILAIVLLMKQLLLSTVKPNQAYLTTIIFLMSPDLIYAGAGLLADVPLALFFLSAAATVILAEKHLAHANRLYSLAGLFAGLSGWVKNEGLMFICVFTVAVTLSGLSVYGAQKTGERMKWFLGGLAPVLVFLLFFKLVFVGDPFDQSNDLLDSFSTAVWYEKLYDPHRWGLILAYVFRDVVLKNFPVFCALGMHCLIAKPRTRKNPSQRYILRTVGLTFVLMCAGYFTVYLLTARPLDWHLDTSVARLYVHCLPFLLLGYSYFVSEPMTFDESSGKGCRSGLLGFAGSTQPTTEQKLATEP